MTDKISLVIIDDHPMFRSGVARSLTDLGFEILAEGASAGDAVLLAARHSPDAMLVDISMPGNGLTSIQTILTQCPSIKVIILTASESGDDVRKAILSGASGYVLKGIGSRDLASVVRTVIIGGSYVPPELSAKLVTEQEAASTLAKQRGELSEREREVMDLISVGMSNKLVARRLGLHEKTVKHHVTRIFAKLQVTNRTEAALRWRG